MLLEYGYYSECNKGDEAMSRAIETMVIFDNEGGITIQSPTYVRYCTIATNAAVEYVEYLLLNEDELLCIEADHSIEFRISDIEIKKQPWNFQIWKLGETVEADSWASDFVMYVKGLATHYFDKAFFWGINEPDQDTRKNILTVLDKLGPEKYFELLVK